jgi:hypothetical protein
LQHEEEDLPPFVVDRVKQAKAVPSLAIAEPPPPAFTGKMETPVTYFYSPTARSVNVSVRFPTGLLTQWYPYVTRMAPVMFQSPTGPIEPQLSVGCMSARGMETESLLDWGKVDILPRDTVPKFPSPIDGTSWGFARNTASNGLRVNDQEEKFLFYRGLGAPNLPVMVKFDGASPTFGSEKPIGAMILMQVTKDGAGFVDLGAMERSKRAEIPAPTMNHDAFVSALSAHLQKTLVAGGLYSDEAQSMVDTWKRSYFLTPGVRLLYLLPAAQIDEVIPLSITPKPDVTQRTMVIRVELMTPSYEAQLVGWLKEPDAEMKAHFLSLGRFAEPHLTRALAMHDTPAGYALLDEIRARKGRWKTSAVQ